MRKIFSTILNNFFDSATSGAGNYYQFNQRK